MQSPMANNQSNVNNTNTSNNSIIMLRDYRKGNWTLQETMVLIEAKKMDEERRTKRSSESTSKAGGGELRWKWVEDYCWRHGCLRSQNQCNDKWDNLMRDFKRVRDHQTRLLLISDDAQASSRHHQPKSYWETDRVERKDRNLPSNMLAQVYDALLDVVERRSGGFRSTSTLNNMVQAQAQAQAQVLHTQTQATLLQPVPNVMAAPLVVPPLLSLPLTQSVGPPPIESLEKHHFHRPLPTVDYDTSEHSDSLPSKRRKKGGEKEASTSTTNIGSEISKSACLIAEAIHACDEREDARHKDLLTLHQKRLQIEESKAEVTKQGFNGLVDAINKLANSILALANSNKNH